MLVLYWLSYLRAHYQNSQVLAQFFCSSQNLDQPRQNTFYFSSEQTSATEFGQNISG